MICLEHAFASLQWLEEPALLPDFVHSLQDRRKSKDLEHGNRMLFYMCAGGLETHALFGNHLFPVLIEYSGFHDAKRVFNKLPARNQHTWTSLIQYYLERGKWEFALSLYQEMQDDRVNPSVYTFVPLLKACCRSECDTSVKELHADIIKRGFENDNVLGNTLVDMYAKCCMIEETHQVFDRLPHQDLISWNVLIAGYAERGLYHEVHTIYTKMLLEGLLPDSFTFVCILKSCTNGRCIGVGQEIHAEILKEGYEECGFVASKLVDMYAQCGSLTEAQEVFDQLSTKDVVIWTALIAGYAEHGPAEEALNCLQKMQLEGLNPDGVTLVCILKACGSIGAIDKGREIHAQIVKQEEVCDSFLGNTLVCMYARCGWLADSRQEFEKLQNKDAISWMALLSGYAECGYGKEAVESFERMHVEGVSPNAATFACVMRVQSTLCIANKGRAIHAEIVKRGLETDASICDALLEFYLNRSFLDEAQEVFGMCGIHDVGHWNLLIAGYAGHGLSKEVLECFGHMQVEGVLANEATYVCCLNFCAFSGNTDMGHILHAQALKKGLERELSVGSALMEFYAKCGSLEELEEMFCKLPNKDVVFWNIMIEAYIELEFCDKALGCLKKMHFEGVLPDVASWNIIILGFVERGQSTEGLELYPQMQAQGLSPDEVMFVSVVKACGEVAALEFGKRVHAQSVNMDSADSIKLSNALIDMYGKCGDMALAQEIFELESSKVLVGWNALLAGYARQGMSDLVFHYFCKMREQCIQPDEITFLSLLTACSHVGSLYRGQEWFEIMTENSGFSPSIKHYTCMIDLFGRAGHLDEAMIMMGKMPRSLDPMMWDTMMDAFQKGGDIELTPSMHLHF